MRAVVRLYFAEAHLCAPPCAHGYECVRARARACERVHVRARVYLCLCVCLSLRLVLFVA